MPHTLRIGATGAGVAELHKALAAIDALGPAAADEVRDQRFGAATAAAIFAFQQQRGLGADGIVGPITWAALRGLAGPPPDYDAAPHAVARRALQLAHEDLLRGRREDPPESNRGPELEEILRGWKGRHGRRYLGGAKWCGLWLDWLYSQAYELEKVSPNPLEKMGGLASASGVLRAARSRDMLMPIGSALPGDIGIVLSESTPESPARTPAHLCMLSGRDGARIVSMDANQVQPPIKFRVRSAGDFAGAVRMLAR